MIASLRQLFRAKPQRLPPAIPPGQRVYAVGDIHGRNDLFAALIKAIDADDAARPPADTTVILLGDLVDRGPDSAGVIASAMAWQQRRKLRALAGNHEEMFLESFDKTEVLRFFLRAGGRETLLSYPISLEDYERATIEETQELMHAAIPDADVVWLRSMEAQIAIGDYLFVHAGIQPGRPLDKQTLSDLRWIREPFLSFGGNFGPVVVHGHTIVEAAEIRANRIAVDTGAFASGLLTALCLEGTTQRLIEARETDGEIATAVRKAA